MGIQINGNTDVISAADGSLTVLGTELKDLSQLNVTGVVTATAYYGSGANLTGIDATQIQTGNTSVQTVDTGSDGHVKVTTEGTERLRITSGGQILLNGVTDKATTGTSATDLLMANNAALRFRKADDSVWINTISVDSNNDLRIGQGGSVDEITFGISGIGDVLKIESDGDVVPVSDNSYDLGSASLRWANIYSADVQLSNEGSSNDVDGTWGKYTIQEGENDLFLINRRTGKKYKFMLEEVE